MHYKSGMTLVETMVAIAIFSIIATALISMAVTTLSAQQSAKLKNLATRCAESKMEEIKSWEANNRSVIQAGLWTGFPSSGNCPPFFTVAVTSGTTTTVRVTWSEKGQSKAINLVTKITIWL
ncbi:MAG: type II secretion system protein [Patescibacteria group bacterium]